MKRLLLCLKSSIKFIVLLCVALVLISAAVFYIYKPTYSVTLNGEFIGYTKDKSELQKRINDYMNGNADENIAFKQVDVMPEYKLCLLKKGIVTNDDEIYEAVVKDSVSYYKYYAIAEDSEEKLYVSKFDEAEDIINQLKEKDSTNIDKLSIVEKYETQLGEFKSVEDAVDELYVERVKVVTVAKRSTASAGASTANTSGNVVNLGINLINPVPGTISSRYGRRWGTFHKGLDIAASYGTPIKAAASGTVTQAGWNSGGYGYLVVISHGNGIQTYYGHCSSVAVSVGQSVSAGTVIAYVGSTGDSTGNHLHFEVRVNSVTQNPENYVY